MQSSRISLPVTLGKSPAMNHLSMHSQTLFCRQLVGKVQDRARNDLAAATLVRGLGLDFLPRSLCLRCRYILYDEHFAREHFVGADGWGGLGGCNIPLPNRSTVCCSLHPLPMPCDLW